MGFKKHSFLYSEETLKKRSKDRERRRRYNTIISPMIRNERGK